MKDPITRELSVKRVIALPGETVRLHPDGVYVDEVRIYEPYLPPGTTTGPGPDGYYLFTIPENCYFVMGDNRRYSADSRHYGPIHLNAIEGLIRL